jgi:hypothetical protein
LELLIIGGLIGLFFAFANSSNSVTETTNSVIRDKKVHYWFNDGSEYLKINPDALEVLQRLDQYNGDIAILSEKTGHSSEDTLRYFHSDSRLLKYCCRIVLRYSIEGFDQYFLGTSQVPEFSTEETQTVINTERERYTAKSTSKKQNKKPKVYWFENGVQMFQSKPWLREFLIELDIKYKGNLEKKCKDGGEPLSDVMAFIESDPQLHRSVKVIILKYSESRYEKYFGQIKSKHQKYKSKSDRSEYSSTQKVVEPIEEIPSGTTSAAGAAFGLGRGLITEFNKRLAQTIQESQEYYLSINDQRQEKHFKEYIDQLKRVEIMVEPFTPNDWYGAFMILHDGAKGAGLSTVVESSDLKVEFQSGVTEGFRWAIQTLVAVIEYAPLYSPKGPDEDPFASLQIELSHCNNLFFESPFSYDHFLNITDEMRMMSMPFAVKFSRKSRIELEPGMSIPWA